MFTSKLSEINDKLTYSEQLIANAILSDYTDFEVVTSVEMAEKVGVGQATVIRFSKKLGYPTFKSMMLDIATDSSFYSSNEVRDDEATRSIMGKLKNLYEVSVDDALTNNTAETIDSAVNAIENANQVFCYGVRTSLALVEIMYYRLLEIGENVIRSLDTLEAISLAQNLTKDDVLFIVSVSGETAEAVTVTKCAKEQGATIISITGSQNNTIQGLSTISLKSAEYDMRAHRFNLVNRCSQLFLLDSIFMKLWKNDDERYIRQILEITDKHVEAGLAISHKDNSYRL
jgi:DNA-binding MurR/RpiR family transcriptional regulator